MLVFKSPILSPLLLLALAGDTFAKEADPITLFDMFAMRDASTLDVEIIRDWHLVDGPVPTRQKMVTIHVGEIWPGQEYRMPVRMVVPDGSKARGFHLTGGNRLRQLSEDRRLSPLDQRLAAGGVGFVDTLVQTPEQSGIRELADESEERFAKTLNPHHKIQYWAWPATLMRAVTMAFSETDYFAAGGKVAMSGGSKNGATPSLAIIHDDRMTAVHATVSPIWDSPLRMCDKAAWESLEKQVGPLRHAFLGGHYGPIFNRRVLDHEHDWKDLQSFARRISDGVFVSRNLKALRARGVDMLFHPGTHDFVCFDLAWGGKHHPTIPVYLQPNFGHGHRGRHPGSPRGEQNKAAFLLNHFFDDVADLLPSPKVEHALEDGFVKVRVQFADDAGDESGRIFWIYDRDPDGCPQYLRRLIKDDDWAEMKRDPGGKSWTAQIPFPSGKRHVDFFTIHRKTIKHEGRSYPTCISCPYTRVKAQ